jgi:signal transduction histidine kinase/ActR/RegA family two-component response regulator/HAMP domain-containing protein
MIVHRLRRSLPARLFAAVFTLGAATVVATATMSYGAAELTLRERLLDQLETAAGDDAQRLSAWLARQRAAAEVLARALRVSSPATGAIDDPRPLPSMPRDVIALEEMHLITVPGGRIVRANDPAFVGGYAVDQLYYREGQRATFTQAIYPGGPDGRPRLTIAVPVRDSTDEVDAVLAVHLDLAEMEHTLSRTGGSLSVNAFLVNRFAEFVSAERFGRTGMRRGVNSLAVREAIAGRSGTGEYRDHLGRAVVGAWRWIPELELAVVREVPADIAFAPARTLLVRTLVLGLVATGLLALGVLLITRRFTRPVLSVAEAASRVAGGDFDVVAAVGSEDEVGQLARAFNVMTGRLRHVYGELEAQVAATRNALTEVDASRALLQDLMDNTTALVLVVGLDARVRLVNARMTALTGVPAHDAVGRDLDALLGVRGLPLAAVLGDARTAATLVEREVQLEDFDDAHTWQVVAFPLVHRDGTVYATGLIATDLTERARAESERRVRDANVQQAQKLESLGVMAGGIAHDFNNLLGAILGNADLARESLERAVTGRSREADSREADSRDADGPEARDARDALDQIAAAGRRAAELTRQMLAYAGRASLRRDVVDARHLVDDIVPLVRAAQPKKVEFVVAPMPDPLWVELDPAQLAQVLLNLLTNAAEAIGDANGVVTLRARRLQDDGDGAVQLMVEDTGAGMTDAVRARVFDPFFSTKGSGRGLGLSAVRGIVQSLGGELAVCSTPGVGTRFEITLRAALPPAAGRTPDVVPDAEPACGTVLIIDDEPSMRSVARRVVERLGLSVLEAEDGAQGLALFAARAHEVSVVLLDLTMPKLGGEEVLAHIRATHPTLPVIVASGYDHADALARMPDDGCTTFLQKPFGVQALREAIGEALGAARHG